MNWNDIKIGHYAQIVKLNEDSFEDQLKAIGIVNNLTLDEVRKLPLEDLNKLTTDFAKLSIKDIPNKPVSKFEEYKVYNNIKEITAGQMIDYDYIREQGDEIQNLHKFMAVLTNPDNEEELNKRANYFWDNMPIGVAYGTHVFFCNLHKRYEESIRAYSKGMEKAIHLENIGVGLRLSMFYRKVIQYLKTSLFK
jgi:hypothetical protein